MGSFGLFEKSPDALKNIREVSEVLDVPASVLRFWETQFSEIRPLKMKGARRYYRPQDIDTLSRIKSLLYAQGYTIKGAKKRVRDTGEMTMNNDPESLEKDLLGDVVQPSKPKRKPQTGGLSLVVNDTQNSSHHSTRVLTDVKSELVALRDLLAPYI